MNLKTPLRRNATDPEAVAHLRHSGRITSVTHVFSNRCSAKQQSSEFKMRIENECPVVLSGGEALDQLRRMWQLDKAMSKVGHRTKGKGWTTQHPE